MVPTPYRIQAARFHNRFNLKQCLRGLPLFGLSFSCLFSQENQDILTQEVNWVGDQEIIIELPDTASDTSQNAPEADTGPETPENKQDSPPEFSDPTALRIVNNYLNVLGGEAAISKTKNIVMRAKENSGRHEFETLIFRDAAGKARVERVGLDNGRPTEFHWVSNGQDFWSVNLYRDKELVQWFTEAEMKAFLFEQSLYPALYDYANRGVKLRYLGKETQNRQEYFLVKAYFPSGIRIEYLFHQEKFLPVKYRYKTKYNGNTGYRIITPTRYKRINGALWQMDYTVHFGELPLDTFVVDRAEGNQRLPESLFLAPERQELQGALPDAR